MAVFTNIDIKKRRELLKMTAATLAEQIGRDPTTIYNWESGKSDPDPDSMYQIAEAFGDLNIWYLMIYSVEILADIAFHNGPVFCIRLSADKPNPIQQALCRCKRSLVLAATIAVPDEPFFHVWIDLPIDRPLHNAVSKSERHNETRFRVSHIELSVIADCIAPVKKLALDFQQIFFQSEAESNNFVAIPLAASGFAVCREEIIKRTDAIFQVMQLFQKSHSVLLRVAFPLCVGCRVVLRAAIAFRPSGRFAAMSVTIVSGLFVYHKLLDKYGDENGVFDAEYAYIVELYHDCQRNNSFL